jgi:hypothetical protein
VCKLLGVFSLFLLLAVSASAENWVCYDETTKFITRAVEGDGNALGITGLDNRDILSNCFEATKTEIDKARQRYKKINTTNSIGNRVVNITRAEQDSLEAFNISERTRVSNVEDSIKTKIGLTDEEATLLFDHP